MNKETVIEQTINNLSQLIYHESKIVSSEQYHPCGDPDKMDQVISDGKAKIKELRRIRQEFEDLMTNIIW